MYTNPFFKYVRMFRHGSSSKGKGKKGNSSSSSRSQSDMSASLFRVIVSFHFHLYVLVCFHCPDLFDIFLLLFFLGHFGEPAVTGAAPWVVARAGAAEGGGGSRADDPSDR